MNSGSQQSNPANERDRVVRRDSKGRFAESGQPVDRDQDDATKTDADEDRND